MGSKYYILGDLRSAGLEYFAVYMLPLAIVGIVATKSEKVGNALGCLSMILLPAFQVFGILVFIFTLSPIILGLSNDAAWTFPWLLASEGPGTHRKACGGGSRCWGNRRNHTYSQANSVSAHFASGRARFRAGLGDDGSNAPWGHVRARSYLARILVYSGSARRWWADGVDPGISGCFCRCRHRFCSGRGLGQLLAMPFAGILGFIPVFIYGAWLGTQSAAQVRGRIYGCSATQRYR